MRIIQMSDIHGGAGFYPELMDAAIKETNAFAPDLVAIPGDLTMEGHQERGRRWPTGAILAALATQEDESVAKALLRFGVAQRHRYV